MSSSKFQLLTGFVNLNGDRGNTVFRGIDDPMTYPEMLALRVLHGGDEHVHNIVEVGTVDRAPMEEFQRLSVKYGQHLIANMFPGVGNTRVIPARDDSIPTREDVEAANAAAAEALAARKNGSRKSKPKAATETPAPTPAPDPDTVPDLTASK